MGQAGVSREERLWAALAHVLALVGMLCVIFGFIPPLIVYLVYKDKSQFVAFHALQSLYFQLVLLVISLVLFFSCVGIPAIVLIAIGALIYIIIVAIRSYNGELFEYFIVGKWAKQTLGM